MSDDEVAKIICEYMGFEYCKSFMVKEGEVFDVKYLNSIDSLLPVLKKLSVAFEINFDYGGTLTCIIVKVGAKTSKTRSFKIGNVPNILAHTTAACIKELTSEDYNRV